MTAPSPSLPSPWLTTEQAASYAQTSARTIYNAVREGKLRAARINGRRDLRFVAAWLDQWLESSVPQELAK
jgi:excisionase family DNA binding protein